jgi:hypothetical protein
MSGRPGQTAMTHVRYVDTTREDDRGEGYDAPLPVGVQPVAVDRLLGIER